MVATSHELLAVTAPNSGNQQDAKSFETTEPETYIQGGVIPPRGMTQGSAASYPGGDIFSLETLRRAQGTEFITT